MIFLNKIDLAQFLTKTKNEKKFKAATTFYFVGLEMRYRSYSNLAEINNLLEFIRVNEEDRKSLIQKSSEEKNFKNLKKFLLNYNFNFNS